MAIIVNDEDALRKAVFEKLNDPALEYTYTEMHERTGVARSYINQIKLGQKPGSLSAIMRLATFLGIKYRFDAL